MRLAFVHGINNQDKTVQNIEEKWWGAIKNGWLELGLQPKQRPPIDVGYYADILFDSMNGRKPAATAQGGNATSRALADEFLKEYQLQVGISDDEIKNVLKAQGVVEPEIVEQGLFQEILVDTASAIETILIGRGKWIAKGFLRQATHYIEDKGLQAQIGLTVRKSIFDHHNDPVLLVSHSLGTVVSYKLLASDAKMKARTVPLFITLGSPLGIGMMQQILPANIEIPNPPIKQWVNGFRRDDFVALDRALTPATIGVSGIINISENLLEEADKHSISAYLLSGPICARIYDILP